MADAAKGAGRAYMQEDLHIKAILLTGVAILAAIGLALGAAFLVIHLGNAGEPAPRLSARFGEPPRVAGRVVLQPDPAFDIHRYRAEKQRLLESYAWVDSSRGIARIPIERGMTLLANRVEHK